MALFFIFSAIFFLLAIHSFVTYPLSLKLLKKVKHCPIDFSEPAVEPFAICVCAYNEAGIIREKMENLLALKARYTELEVLIYIDAATDATADIVREYADRFFVHVATERHGKSYGMNLLVRQATAPLLIFSDANVMLDMDAPDALRKYFGDKTVGCVCGHLIYVNPDDGVTAKNGSLYWRMEEKLKQTESDTGSAMGADGSIFAIRRALHNPPPVDIIDDMYVSMSILCNGYRIVRADDVKAYEKTVTAGGEEFRRKVRIACQSFNVHRLLWPRLKQLGIFNFYKYISHKFLRWFVIYFLGLSGIFFLAGLIAAGLTWLAILLPLLAVGGLWFAYARKISPASQIVDVLSAFAGVGVGLWKSMRGERFQTWSPAQSIRGTEG